MYLNNIEVEKLRCWEVEKRIKRFLFHLILLSFYLFIFCCTSAQAEPVKVSLILGDNHSRMAIEAVKAIQKEYPDLKERVSFNLYFTKGIRERDLTPVKESKLILIFTMGRQLSDAVTPELDAAIKKGAKVYSFGGTYDDDHKRMGILIDKRIVEYYQAGGIDNLKNMILYASKKDLGLDVSPKDAVKLPESGIYERRSRRIFDDFEEYKRSYASFREGSPWIGIVFYKTAVETGQAEHLDAVIRSLEESGFNVLPVCGSPPDSIMERFFLDGDGKSRVRLVVAVGLKVGVNPKKLNPVLERLGVPVVNAVTLYSQSREEWEKSPVGLDIFERGWQIAGPELAGIIQPTVIASKERMTDKETGIEYTEDRPIPERIERLTERVRAWVNLQDKPDRDKKVAIIYYNYPPGKQNIGAAYLNVLPESLWEILGRLRAEGYGVGERDISKDELFKEIHEYGRNIGNWAQGEIDRVVRSGKPVLISVATYKKWFNELPEGLKKAVMKSWGPVEKSNIMTWQDAAGERYIVIPAVRYGNVLFTPQPSKGWEQDANKLYHDVTIPPHHQYIAFYLWLKKGFKADAVAHIGTHGTHEWLSGKEVGFTNEDPPEALIQDMPNIYPYIVDDVGEGLQAKRRGMAVVIDHMTPPFDKAGLNKELREMAALISDYNAAKEKSPALADSKLEEINKLAAKTGLLTDLKLGKIKTNEEIEEVDDYIKEIAEKQTPFGLHTFGKAPEEKYRRTTAEAIMSIEKGLTPEEKERRISDMEEKIVSGAKRELDSFVAALDGRYISAGQGNDPIRNPDSLPTGKNFYSFDPTMIPSKGTYETGAKLAKALVEGYRHRHGQYPDKLTFNLWGTETIRHEGVMESQIMNLMGIRPKWDARGRVIGVEAIPRGELGRQRIDVTIVPSGLYRDLFSNLMDLLDKAVAQAKEQDEEDNSLRANVQRTKDLLLKKGVSEEMAERLASVRIFTEPSGAYGTNIDKAITMSNTWDNERQVADLYFMRMSHPYGQGFWGNKVTSEELGVKSKEDLGLVLFKNALSGSKMAVHSKSGNVIATLDNDDFFQYLGGTAMAIRAVDGKTPEVYVTNMSNPKKPEQETLEKFMGREMRARYLNPEWIKAMMKEGYAGARFVDKVVEHLWGWQVTVPEAVDAAKWNEMYETYVLDRNGLNIKEMFRKSKNMWAYQSIVARMLETVRKDYWKPDKEVIETLAKEYAESVKEVGLACCDHTCNNPQLTKFTASVLMSVPGTNAQVSGFMKALDAMKNPAKQRSRVEVKRASISSPRPKPAPDGSGKKVEGYEMQDINESGASSAPIPYLFLLGFLIFIGLIAFGWRRKA